MSKLVRGDLSPGGSRFYEDEDLGWQRLWLNERQVLEVCREHFGLGADSASLLAERALNQTWRIHADDRDRVLRVSRRQRTAEQVAYERAAAEIWHDVVPQVIVAEHRRLPVVDGHVITLFPYVAGVSGTTVPARERAQVIIPLVAKLHTASVRAGLPQRPGVTMLHEAPRWYDWDETRAKLISTFGHCTEIDTIDRTIADLDDRLDRWQRDGRLSTCATVHGDLNARNQIYRDGRLVGIIDTDECHVEPLIADIAGFAYGSADIAPDEVWQDYLDSGGPLDPADRDMLVHLANATHLSNVVWLTDEHGDLHHFAPRMLSEIVHTITERADQA